MTISALQWCMFLWPLPFLNHLPAYFLHFQSDMTPSGSSHSKSSSSWTAETPKTTKDLKKQGGLVRHLLGSCTASPCPVNQAVNQVIKWCENAMNNALLLDHEVHHLCMANQCQKRKQGTSKAYIASGGVLTGGGPAVCTGDARSRQGGGWGRGAATKMCTTTVH